MPNHENDLAANRARIRALPMFWDGPIPPERDRRVEDDDKSFSEVLLLYPALVAVHPAAVPRPLADPGPGRRA